MNEKLSHNQDLNEKLSKPKLGSSPETAIYLTEKMLARMSGSVDVQQGEELVGSSTDDDHAYVRSSVPRTVDRRDGSKVTYNIWGVNANPADYGTRVKSMGLFHRNDKDGSITIVEPAQPKTPAPGEPGSRENPIVVAASSTEHSGGYTGERLSQHPNALYQTGMPIRLDSLTNPVEGMPQVPRLPGDPRDNQ